MVARRAVGPGLVPCASAAIQLSAAISVGRFASVLAGRSGRRGQLLSLDQSPHGAAFATARARTTAGKVVWQAAKLVSVPARRLVADRHRYRQGCRPGPTPGLPADLLQQIALRVTAGA